MVGTTLESTVWDEYTSAADLTAFSRGLLDEYFAQDTLGQFLPVRNINDLEYRFNRGTQALQEMAVFRSYDTPPVPIAQPTQSAGIRGELPPLAEEIRMSEIQHLKQRNASANEFSMTIAEKAELLVNRIVNKMLYLGGQMLSGAAFTIAENGIVANVDFGRDAALTIAAPATWNDGTTADIPTQIGDMDQAILDAGGLGLSGLVMSREKWSQMAVHESMRNAFVSAAGAPLRLGSQEVSAILTNLLGKPIGIQLYDRQFDVRNDQGVVTKVRPIAANTVVGVPDRAVGATLFGRTAEADVIPLAAQSPEGIVVYPEQRMKPVNHYVASSAIGLPVPGDGMINSTASMTV